MPLPAKQINLEGELLDGFFKLRSSYYSKRQKHRPDENLMTITIAFKTSGKMS